MSASGAGEKCSQITKRSSPKIQIEFGCSPPTLYLSATGIEWSVCVAGIEIRRLRREFIMMAFLVRPFSVGFSFPVHLCSFAIRRRRRRSRPPPRRCGSSPFPAESPNHPPVCTERRFRARLSFGPAAPSRSPTLERRNETPVAARRRRAPSTTDGG